MTGVTGIDHDMDAEMAGPDRGDRLCREKEGELPATGAVTPQGKEITMKETFCRLFLIVAFLFLSPISSFAEVEVDPKVNQILLDQLDALKNNDFEKFMKRGNRAFNNLFNKFQFDTLYERTEMEFPAVHEITYLGCIQRMSMIEYLWKFTNKSNGYEHLIRMTLTRYNEYLAGFDFD